MKRTKSVIIIAATGLVAIAGVALALQFDLSALPEPGRVEVELATHAKHFLIRRASRSSVPAQLSDVNTAEGKRLYETECAMCHGVDGRARTDNGRWMYPRAADLRSTAVKKYSERELFWILKNGIRLSGMPAFGKVETDEHIWEIVQYVRSL